MTALKCKVQKGSRILLGYPVVDAFGTFYYGTP